jgi:hypothetical protein
MCSPISNGGLGIRKCEEVQSSSLGEMAMAVYS